MDLKSAIRDMALKEGFDAVGFSDAETGPGPGTDLLAFLKEGLHGDMTWMAEKADRRVNPKALWPEVRSVIVLGMNYGPANNPLDMLDLTDRGNISIYARGRDYHDLVKKRLKRIARWLVETEDCDVKVFTDTAPVMEKPLAQQAGIGWQGKHTNLVSKDLGSWFFLGEIFTTLQIPPDKPEIDHCGTCTRCLDACPTKALTAPYRMDARRCISYLTIEYKDDIPDELSHNMGNRIYGCDDCLAVCPWNKFSKPAHEDAFHPRAELNAPRLADLCRLDDAAFRDVFSGSPVKRTGRDRFVRNVIIAISNTGDKSLINVLKERLEDDSELVRKTALRAITRLSSD